MKESNCRRKDESVFARSTTQIVYSFEQEKQKEGIENHFLPLLVRESSDWSSFSISPTSVSPAKMPEIDSTLKLMSPSKYTSCSNKGKKTRLKIRNPFSGNRRGWSSSGKSKNKKNTVPLSDLASIPQLSLVSKDTEEQSDCEGKGQSEQSLDDEPDSKETCNDDIEIHAFIVENESMQKDLTKFLTEIEQEVVTVEEDNKRDTANVLNELACMENIRCEVEPPRGESRTRSSRQMKRSHSSRANDKNKVKLSTSTKSPTDAEGTKATKPNEATVVHTESYDDEATVVTIKCSNLSSKQGPFNRKMHPSTEANQHQINTSNDKDVSGLKRKKCQQAMRVSSHKNVS